MKKLSSIITALILFTLFVTVSADNSPFSDVESEAWYYADVMTAYKSGLINGKGKGTFKPDDTMTYAEAIKLAACVHQLYREGEITLTNGKEVWYLPYSEYCIQNGLMHAHNDKFDEPIERGVYIDMFARAMNDSNYKAINHVPYDSIPDVTVDHGFAESVYKLYRAGILTGVDADRTCGINSYIKRSEVATVLSRMIDESRRVSFSMAGYDSEISDSTPLWHIYRLPVHTDFSAYVEVEHNDYFGIELTAYAPTCTEEEIDQRLDEFVSSCKVYEKVSREARSGDMVAVSITLFLDGEERKSELSDIVIGSGTYIRDLETAMLGHKAGDVIDFEIAYESYHISSEVRGKTVPARATVKLVSERRDPVLSNKLIRDNTEFDSISEYREHLKDVILEEKIEQRKWNELYPNTYYRTADNIKLKHIPDEIVQYEYDISIAIVQLDADKYGVDLETLVTDFAGLRYDVFQRNTLQEARIAAEQSVILFAIAQREGILKKLTVADLKRYCEIFAEDMDISAEELMSGELRKKAIESTVIYETLNMILDNAHITETEYPLN